MSGSTSTDPPIDAPVPAPIGAPIRRQGPPEPGTLRDRSRPGRRAFSLPPPDVDPVEVPQEHRRRSPARLPEIAERDLVSHFTRLSQMNYGVDTGIYPLGSCSMKYNPKSAEAAASLPGFQRIHPLQPDHTVQGALEVLWRLERALCEITGMARATLQPPAGACGELTGLLIFAGREPLSQLLFGLGPITGIGPDAAKLLGNYKGADRAREITEPFTALPARRQIFR